MFSLAFMSKHIRIVQSLWIFDVFCWASDFHVLRQRPTVTHKACLEEKDNNFKQRESNTKLQLPACLLVSHSGVKYLSPSTSSLIGELLVKQQGSQQHHCSFFKSQRNTQMPLHLNQRELQLCRRHTTGKRFFPS